MSAAATLLVEKYADGLPLHRQRERLSRLVGGRVKPRKPEPAGSRLGFRAA